MLSPQDRENTKYRRDVAKVKHDARPKRMAVQEDLEEEKKKENVKEKEKENEIDKIIADASAEKGWDVDEAILAGLTSSISKTGKLSNLSQAIELLNGTGDINNFQDFIKDELEADKLFQRVLSRVSSRDTPSASALSNTASSQMSINLSMSQSFKSDKSGKSYGNREQTGYFDNLFRFTLNKDCYIIYEKREDNSFYIDMIRCEPGGFWRGGMSVKGSGRVMIYDWLLFLTQKNNKRKSKYNDSTPICLTPEPSVGRVEHRDPGKLGIYYSEMGFNPPEVEGSREWCGTIGDIMTRIDAIVGITTSKEGTPDGLLIKLGDISEEDGDYGGGRRKLTRKKRRKTRKTRKSRKTKTIRKRK
jgi:hypothetical protein